MGDSHMNWIEIFEEFTDQAWTAETKLGLLLEFLDQNDGIIVVTVDMFREHLSEITGQEIA
mgnify:CR=1 FL=1